MPYIMELLKVGAAFFLLTTFSQAFANILVLTGLVSVVIYASGWFFTTNKTVVSLVGQFHALMKALLGTPNATHLGVTILSVILIVAGWYLLDDTKFVESPEEEEVTPS